MERANWHTYQVLTKRSSGCEHARRRGSTSPPGLANIWWGVSVEDRAHGLPGSSTFAPAPAAVRFLSVEPLLEDLGEIDLEGIHWVIVGGESGPARPADAEGVGALDPRSVRSAPASPSSSSSGAVFNERAQARKKGLTEGF